MPIQLDQPIWFVDDRRKVDDLFKLIRILWQNKAYVLAEVELHIYDETQPLYPPNWQTEPVAQPFLFDVEGSVLNQDYDSFDAINDISSWRPFGWTGD